MNAHAYLSRCIEEGQLAVQDAVKPDVETLRRIEFAFDQLLPEHSLMNLKPVFEAFEGRYDYGLLRCVQAGMGRESQ